MSVDYGTMTSFYSLPDITVYQNGMFYHGKLYCGEGTSLPLTYEPRADYTFTGFQVNGAPPQRQHPYDACRERDRDGDLCRQRIQYHRQL